jgi:electron transport complex protein RnfB
MSEKDKTDAGRRKVLGHAIRAGVLGGLAGLGGTLTALGGKRRKEGTRENIWQIDPEKCIQCGNCATYCVVKPSAVKCVHAFDLCGYCDLCFGYFDTTVATEYEAGAPDEFCPTAAILRRHIEDVYYEYLIDEPKCIGCGLCVKGCDEYGNGSLHLQIKHDLCVHCNECAIAAACPANAIVRVPASQPYLRPRRKEPGK